MTTTKDDSAARAYADLERRQADMVREAIDLLTNESHPDPFVQAHLLLTLDQLDRRSRYGTDRRARRLPRNASRNAQSVTHSHPYSPTPERDLPTNYPYVTADGGTPLPLYNRIVYNP